MKTRSFRVYRWEITEYKEGNKNGKYIRWHRNGQKYWIFRFKEGEWHGNYIVWGLDGIRWGRGEFKNGKLVI